MDVLTDDLREALAILAPPLMLAAFNRAAEDASQLLTSEEAGALIAKMVCPETRYGDLGAKALIGCELFHAGEMAWLTPADCAMHPGLSDWSPCTLGQAFMLPVETAYGLTAGTVAVPIFESVGVVIGEGVCSGQIAMTFSNGARAICYYGQRVPPGVALFASTTHAVGGDGLFEVGNKLRRSANESARLAAALESTERAYVQETVH